MSPGAASVNSLPYADVTPDIEDVWVIEVHGDTVGGNIRQIANAHPRWRGRQCIDCAVYVGGRAATLPGKAGIKDVRVRRIEGQVVYAAVRHIIQWVKVTPRGTAIGGDPHRAPTEAARVSSVGDVGPREGRAAEARAKVRAIR